MYTFDTTGTSCDILNGSEILVTVQNCEIAKIICDELNKLLRLTENKRPLSPREKVQFLSGLGHTDADIWLIIDRDNNLTSISRGDATPKMGSCVLTDGETKYCIFHSIGKNREVIISTLRNYLELRGEL